MFSVQRPTFALSPTPNLDPQPRVCALLRVGACLRQGYGVAGVSRSVGPPDVPAGNSPTGRTCCRTHQSRTPLATRNKGTAHQQSAQDVGCLKACKSGPGVIGAGRLCAFLRLVRPSVPLRSLAAFCKQLGIWRTLRSGFNRSSQRTAKACLPPYSFCAFCFSRSTAPLRSLAAFCSRSRRRRPD